MGDGQAQLDDGASVCSSLVSEDYIQQESTTLKRNYSEPCHQSAAINPQRRGSVAKRHEEQMERKKQSKGIVSPFSDEEPPTPRKVDASWADIDKLADGADREEWISRLQASERVHDHKSDSCRQIMMLMEAAVPEMYALEAAERVQLKGRIGSEIEKAQQVVARLSYHYASTDAQQMRQMKEETADCEDKLARMNNVYLKELSSLRDQKRPSMERLIATIKAIEGDRGHVEYYEPLQYVSQETRSLILTIVDEKLKAVFAFDPTIKQTANKMELAKFEEGLLKDRASSYERQNAKLREEVSELRSKMKKGDVNAEKLQWELSSTKVELNTLKARIKSSQATMETQGVQTEPVVFGEKISKKQLLRLAKAQARKKTQTQTQLTSKGSPGKSKAAADDLQETPGDAAQVEAAVQAHGAEDGSPENSALNQTEPNDSQQADGYQADQDEEFLQYEDIEWPSYADTGIQTDVMEHSSASPAASSSQVASPLPISPKAKRGAPTTRRKKPDDHQRPERRRFSDVSQDEESMASRQEERFGSKDSIISIRDSSPSPRAATTCSTAASQNRTTEELVESLRRDLASARSEATTAQAQTTHLKASLDSKQRKLGELQEELGRAAQAAKIAEAVTESYRLKAEEAETAAGQSEKRRLHFLSAQQEGSLTSELAADLKEEIEKRLKIQERPLLDEGSRVVRGVQGVSGFCFGSVDHSRDRDHS
eukprot:TRINITY_DN23460_c0_g1_i2.p1 TRINITY_DN23460_c0_g1~~TRINITY_DN23460_c0_g1_i2.p1  ORF type:complete len:714 (+),score=185.98 TRINITY_DN23460_c0_g1_i2:250-2391(+)